jgi:transcriptional regulator of NAD metabolism
MPHADGGHVKLKIPKELDEILDRLGRVADVVLTYRPKAKSKPAVQRKRRATILKNAKTKKKGGG